MQIIIDLHPGKPGEEQNIQILLQKLSEAGYSIQEGQDPKVFQEKAKLIVVDTDTKRFYFLNSYFPAVYGFIGKEARPLSLEIVLNNSDCLFRDHGKKDLVKRLYKEQFVTFQQTKTDQLI